MASNTFFHSTPYAPHASRRISEHINPNAIAPEALHSSRKGLAQSIKFYGGRLDKFDPAEFIYLDNIKRQAREEELQNTFYLLYDECRLHALAGDSPLLRTRAEQMDRCAYLIDRLLNTPTLGEKYSSEQLHQLSMETSQDKPMKYLALTLIAPLIAKTMYQITMAERLENMREQMSSANFYRLNWVWGGGLDRTICDAIPLDFSHSQNARTVFADIAPITGYMSWILYYCRLGIELYLLTKGSLKGSWMDPWRSEADKAMNIGIYERFTTQLHQRKFALLNDAFWATANMACFLWLVGEGVLGCTVYMGNALTGALLVFDLMLTVWKYHEKSTEHNQLMRQYDQDIAALKTTIEGEADITKKAVLNEHLDILHQARDECAFDWVYADKQFQTDLLYAVGLFLGFSVMCGFFFPPAALLPSSMLVLALVGSALSFALTVAYHTWITSIEVEKFYDLSIKTEGKIHPLEMQINALINTFDYEEDPHTKQRLRFQIEQLQLERTHLLNDLLYQKEMIVHHKKGQVQQVISETLMPVAAFAFLVFLPIQWGVALLVPTVSCLLMSSSIVESSKPKHAPPDVKGVFFPSNG